ncbi:mercury(II) reductase [Geotalea sp. SG265]|uniref:mercury(II) reductase n=1 Tax=Geotalea sp. SG265 TaxID=2922867 RepID=UPI001FAF52C8|nr:mercury(II) reductase [Geotalea sp. SG265]
MSTEEILIVGSGSTAFAAALRAQALGLTVKMIEKSVLGGTCINWGCIPSKTFIHGAFVRHTALTGAELGMGTATDGPRLSRFFAHKEQVVAHLRQTKYLDVLKKTPGVEVIKGTARFIAPGAVQVEEQVIRSSRILVAVGGHPRIIPIPGLDTTPYLTSRSALLLKAIPRSLIIIGGGVIAVELGQMYLRMGSRVTILEHGPRLLPMVEPELVTALEEALSAEGMEIVVNASTCAVSQDGTGTIVDAEVDGKPQQFRAERLLMAVGTAPATAGIGLEKAGIELDSKGFIRVDHEMRTTAPGIWAAGDAVGGMMIATVGAREGIVAVDNMVNPGCGCRVDYHKIPMAIFTDPEVGIVGYTEAEARKAGFQVTVNTIPAAAIPKSHVTGDTHGAVKMVADSASGRLLGIHLCCHRGADVINEAALAIQCKLTIDDLAGMLHVYPSMAEGLRLCAQGFSRDISRLSCCAE